MCICWIHSHVALEVGQEMAQRLPDLDAERPERPAATASGSAGSEEAAGDAEENDWMLKAQLIGGVYGKYWKISIDYWRRPWFINPRLRLFTSIYPLVN